MRTKALLGLAVLAVSAATCVAQNVYSLNIVGYVNQTVEANKWYLLENPLTKANSGGDVVTNIIQLNNSFNDTAIFTYTAGKLEAVEQYVADYGWFPGTTVLAPGQGFYLYPKAAGTITFVGEVVTASTNTLVPGFNMVGSAFPASLSLTALGLTGVKDDVIFRLNPATSRFLEPVSFIDGYGWWDSNQGDGGPIVGPNLNVGEGVWYFNKNANFTWKQSFTVN